MVFPRKKARAKSKRRHQKTVGHVNLDKSRTHPGKMLHNRRTLDELAHFENAEIAVPRAIAVELGGRIGIAASHREHIIEIKSLHAQFDFFLVIEKNVIEIRRSKEIARSPGIAASARNPFGSIFGNLRFALPVERGVGILVGIRLVAFKPLDEERALRAATSAHPLEMRR